MKKVLIAVKSCHRDRFMHQRILETWGSLVKYYDWIDLRFFIGRQLPGEETSEALWMGPNEVYVPALDGYESLTDKVDAILNWFIVIPEYTHIFQCDTDTYVDVPKLVMAFTGREQYVGYTGMNGVVGAAHGGPGYWLSRDSILEVLRRATRDNIQHQSKDEWWVYDRLQEAGIPPIHDDRYSLLTTPGRDHPCITYHNSRVRAEPEMLDFWHLCAFPLNNTPLYRPHPLSL